jgi:hypothetical protein
VTQNSETIIDAAADPMISEALALLTQGGTPVISLSRPHKIDKRFFRGISS